MCLNSVGNILKRCDTENREWWWRQIKQIYIYIYREREREREVVVKSLHSINC